MTVDKPLVEELAEALVALMNGNEYAGFKRWNVKCVPTDEACSLAHTVLVRYRTMKEAEPDLATLIRRLLDFINQEDPAAIQWEPISPTCEELRTVLARAKPREGQDDA